MIGIAGLIITGLGTYWSFKSATISPATIQIPTAPLPKAEPETRNVPLPNVKNNDNPRNKVLRNSEEPFLHLITIQAQAPSAGQFFQPEFFFENSGLTPAHELQMKSYIWPTTTNLGDTFEYPEVAGDVVTITVAPHESRSVKLKSNIALTQELVAQIESHQLLIYVYARTLFRDSANQWFRWRFCAVYNPDGHDFDLCKYGNDSVKTKKPSRSDP